MKYLYRTRLLLCSFLIFAIFSSFNLKHSEAPCDIKAEVISINQSEVEIKVENALEPIKIFVTDDENITVSEGDKRIKNLSSGKYKYFIHDNQGCWKKGDFEVK